MCPNAVLVILDRMRRLGLVLALIFVSAFVMRAGCQALSPSSVDPRLMQLPLALGRDSASSFFVQAEEAPRDCIAEASHAAMIGGAIAAGATVVAGLRQVRSDTGAHMPAYVWGAGWLGLGGALWTSIPVQVYCHRDGNYIIRKRPRGCVADFLNDARVGALMGGAMGFLIAPLPLFVGAAVGGGPNGIDHNTFNRALLLGTATGAALGAVRYASARQLGCHGMEDPS